MLFVSLGPLCVVLKLSWTADQISGQTCAENCKGVTNILVALDLVLERSTDRWLVVHQFSIFQHKPVAFPGLLPRLHHLKQVARLFHRLLDQDIIFSMIVWVNGYDHGCMTVCGCVRVCHTLLPLSLLEAQVFCSLFSGSEHSVSVE